MLKNELTNNLLASTIYKPVDNFTICFEIIQRIYKIANGNISRNAKKCYRCAVIEMNYLFFIIYCCIDPLKIISHSYFLKNCAHDKTLENLSNQLLVFERISTIKEEDSIEEELNNRGRSKVEYGYNKGTIEDTIEEEDICEVE